MIDKLFKDPINTYLNGRVLQSQEVTDYCSDDLQCQPTKLPIYGWEIQLGGGEL